MGVDACRTRGWARAVWRPLCLIACLVALIAGCGGGDSTDPFAGTWQGRDEFDPLLLSATVTEWQAGAGQLVITVDNGVYRVSFPWQTATFSRQGDQLIAELPFQGTEIIVGTQASAASSSPTPTLRVVISYDASGGRLVVKAGDHPSIDYWRATPAPRSPSDR